MANQTGQKDQALITGRIAYGYDGTNAYPLKVDSSGNLEYSTVTLTSGAGVNVTTASGTVLAANTSRKYALIVNDSDTTIYLAVGATAVANKGIRLNSNGGSYEMSQKMGNLATGAINGIHAGTGNKVALPTEGV